jgi:excisionase family DNA binding protein
MESPSILMSWPQLIRSANGAATSNLPRLVDFIGGGALEKRALPNKMSRWTTMADKDDILLNSREVAFLLDLSPDTVNEFARRNILPAFKKGRQWRFRKRDIASFKRHLRGVNAAA